MTRWGAYVFGAVEGPLGGVMIASSVAALMNAKSDDGDRVASICFLVVGTASLFGSLALLLHRRLVFRRVAAACAVAAASQPIAFVSAGYTYVNAERLGPVAKLAAIGMSGAGVALTLFAVAILVYVRRRLREACAA